MKEGKGTDVPGGEVEIDVPEGIIERLTREYGGNVHDDHVVNATCGSFEKETLWADPHSGAYEDNPKYASKNAADPGSDSFLASDCPRTEEQIPHTRDNKGCYDFKERMIVPTSHAIRTYDGGPGNWHLRLWPVDTSVDGESSREIAREEDNEQLDSSHVTGAFAAAGGGQCGFVRGECRQESPRE
jgi:hypothetical protein